jgi:hypothetical protein
VSKTGRSGVGVGDRCESVYKDRDRYSSMGNIRDKKSENGEFLSERRSQTHNRFNEDWMSIKSTMAETISNIGAPSVAPS